MLLRLILILALTVALFWYYNKLKHLPSEQKKPFIIKGMLWFIVLALLLAIITGKAHPITALFAALLGFAKFGFGALFRAMPLLNLFRRSALFSNYHFATPRFRTAFLALELHLQTGEVKGEVIDGPYAGTSIAHLSEEQLTELETYYQERDKRSYYLIRVIRQKRKQHNQSKESTDNQQNHQSFSNAGEPSIEEALQILGIQSNKPDKKEIVTAHRRLIQKLHPDRGGNDYLASRVNLAKDVLLKSLDC